MIRIDKKPELTQEARDVRDAIQYLAKHAYDTQAFEDAVEWLVMDSHDVSPSAAAAERKKTIKTVGPAAFQQKFRMVIAQLAGANFKSLAERVTDEEVAAELGADAERFLKS